MGVTYVFSARWINPIPNKRRNKNRVEEYCFYNEKEIAYHVENAVNSKLQDLADTINNSKYL